MTTSTVKSHSNGQSLGLMPTPATWESFLSEYRVHKLREQSGLRAECSPESVWLVEGEAILVTERINTTLVNQLLDAIGMFDSFVANAKLTSVQGVLRQAQGQLNDVLTGKRDDKTATAALANTMALYNALSGFFKQDLPTLMRTDMLRTARELWDKSPTKNTTPLAQLPVEHDKIKAMFANALNQKANSGALGYIARRFGIGQKLAAGINPGAVADNLMSMTFADLDALVSGAPKPAPASAPQQLIKQAEAEDQNPAAGASQSGATQANPAVQEPGTTTASGGDPEVISALMKSQNPAILDNAKEIAAFLAKAGLQVVQTR